MTDAPDPISAVFRRTKPDGSYYYSDTDVRHYLPLFIVTTRVSPELLSAESLALFSAFVDALQRETGSAQVTLENVLAYYERHPANPELAREMKAAVQSLASAGEIDVRDNLGQLVTATKFEPRTPPKEGQARGGQLARHAFSPKKS